MTPSMNDVVSVGMGWESLGLSLASLGLVCLISWGALRLLAGRGRRGASGAVRVVARCALEPRRSLYVVAVAGRHLLIGAGDGPLSVLAELDGLELPAAPPAGSATRFGDVLARARGRRSHTVSAGSQGAVPVETPAGQA